MSHWNYRVVKEDTPPGGDDEYAIKEVHYDDKGRPWARTEDASAPVGETLEELTEELDHYRRALLRPVLKADDFVGENPRLD